MALGFEHTTFGTRVSSLNHWTRAPAQVGKISCHLSTTIVAVHLAAPLPYFPTSPACPPPPSHSLIVHRQCDQMAQ